MATRPLEDVVHIGADILFNSGVDILFGVNNRFRAIATEIFRNEVSKSIIHAEARDPANTDQFAGLTQYWINTDTNARFVSDAGGDWEELGASTITGPEIVTLLAALEDDARLSYNNLKDALTGEGIVLLLAALTGDDRLDASAIKNLPTGDGGSVDIDIGIYQTFGSWAKTAESSPVSGQFYVESGEIRIHETNSDSTDKRSDLSGIGIGDRIQFGELNAFEIGAVGVRNNSGLWTFTGIWSETFSVEDFDGDWTVRHIEKSNVLVRNNAGDGKFLKLNDALLPIAHDPESSVDPLWEGSLGSSSVGTVNNLNAGKKFSDYTHIIFNYSGSSKRNLWSVHRKIWTQLRYTEVSNKENHLTLLHASDTSFEVGEATGTILLRKIQGYKGV